MKLDIYIEKIKKTWGKSSFRNLLSKVSELWVKFNPKKSLKNTLSLWFILFALFPLMIIVGYCTYFLNHRINEELIKRLSAFEQGIDIELAQVEERLRMGSFGHASDYYLINLLRSQRITQLENVTQSLIENYIVDRISYFSPKGEHILSVSPRKITQNPEAILPEEQNRLSKKILRQLSEQRQILVKTPYPGIGLVMDCLSTMRLTKKNVGIIKETVILDRSYSLSTKERTGLDMVILDSKFKILISTFNPEQEKTASYPLKEYQKISSLSIQDESYLMLTKPFLDEEEKTAGYLSILVSQAGSQKTLKEIRNIFILLCLGIIMVVIIFTQVALKTVLHPIHALLDAIKDIERGKLDRTVALPQMVEISTVTHSFNAMSLSLFRMKKELEMKVSELQNTQAQLVHSSKMISLGQLVAGVAHELNNPIGYTYSNLSHLKEHLEQLKSFLKTYEKTFSALPKKVQTQIQKSKQEFNIEFILKDIDGIVQSGLEGTQRTKDIVQGLRNFSRLDEAEIKEADIHEGLESTLSLLKNEIKDRITIHKNYGKFPNILCYPSQVNQVFMNILSNSIQAIEGKGDIWIKTETDKNNIFISIRDNGKGIKLEHMDRVFDPFFTTKKIGKGTGLGLSISYGIIQKHNGEIKVASEVEKGSTFTIVLPKTGLKNQFH